MLQLHIPIPVPSKVMSEVSDVVKGFKKLKCNVAPPPADGALAPAGVAYAQDRACPGHPSATRPVL